MKPTTPRSHARLVSTGQLCPPRVRVVGYLRVLMATCGEKWCRSASCVRPVCVLCALCAAAAHAEAPLTPRGETQSLQTEAEDRQAAAREAPVVPTMWQIWELTPNAPFNPEIPA